MKNKAKVDSKIETKVDKTLIMDDDALAREVQVDPDDLKEKLGIKDYSKFDFYGATSSIGEGGVGLVLKGHDPNLGRDVAVKILRPQMRGKKSSLERFIREARATAQIEHPNIVPVHEMGVHKDWGVYFTMKKISGEDLKEILYKIAENDPEYIKKYTLSKLLDIFRDVCNGIAFSHSKGLIHRDLKPENIFVGDYGEVLVLDWGLVREIKPTMEKEDDDEKGSEAEDPFDSSVNIDLDDTKNPELTLDGFVSGTPYYMSPEQARAENKSIDHRSDIYTLGVILYQILTLRLPFDGKDIRSTINAVAIGDFIPPRKKSPSRKIPSELEAICLKAMSYDPKDRYQNVKEFIADIYHYQDDYPISAMQYSSVYRFWKLCKRHPVVSTSISAVLVFGFLGFGVRIVDKYIKYNLLMNRAEQYLAKSFSEYRRARKLNLKIEELRNKRIVKTKSDKEIELEKELAEIESKAENNSEVAKALLMAIPERFQSTPRINSAYVRLVTGKINNALDLKDYPKTSALLDRLELYQKEDPNFMDKEKQQSANELRKIIRGDGSLQIASDQENVDIKLYRLREDENGIITKGQKIKAGKTPIKFAKIPKGNYLLICQKEGFNDVRYPVRIDHAENENANIYMPKTIPDGMVYIPGGKFYIGGQYSRNSRLREIELPSFFIKDKEVTFGEYLEFFKTLKDNKWREKYMPLLRLAREQRCFKNVFDEKNNIVLSFVKKQHPVVGITQEAAAAYCRWLSSKNGIECRLPTAEEWEKTARGVDGRNFVWGNKINLSYAFISENKEAKEKHGYWAPPGQFPRDVSIYGVHDMAGNVREWTCSKFMGNSPFFQIKGASASTTKRFLYCAYASDTPVVPSDVGFRYVSPIKKDKSQSKKITRNK